jgi:hypothetical protein
MIPKNIFQIYHNKSLIKKIVKDEITELNPDYEYFIYDFEEGVDFVKNNFEKDIADKIIYFINNIEKYAHKSDLLRYCLLYIYGGVYLDVDLKQKMSLNEIINQSENSDIITSTGLTGNITRFTEEEYLENNIKYHPIIMNGLLISKPKSNILLNQINYIINGPLKKRHNVNVYYFHDYLHKIYNSNLINFEKLNINNENLYLFKEITYKIGGKNVFINKNNEIIMYSNNYLNKEDYMYP